MRFWVSPSLPVNNFEYKNVYSRYSLDHILLLDLPHTLTDNFMNIRGKHEKVIYNENFIICLFLLLLFLLF